MQPENCSHTLYQDDPETLDQNLCWLALRLDLANKYSVFV